MIITDQNFEEEIAKFEGIALIDFWATWCTPCIMQGPIVEEIAKDLEADKTFKIGKLDTDENNQTAMKFGVMSIPTMKFFKNGELVAELIGLQTKQTIMDKLNELKS